MENKTITLENSNYDIFLIEESKATYESIIIKTSDNINLNNLNVENLNKIFNKVSLNGTIELIFSDKNESNDLKANLRFAGFSNVKIIVGNNQYSLKGKKKNLGNNEEKNQTNTENKTENSWKVVSKVDTLDKINENDLIDPNNIYQQFSKEAMYSSEKMQKRMVSNDELNMSYDYNVENEKHAYLRRKIERGKRF